MRSCNQNTGQSEQAGYLTWAFGYLTWGLVYCTQEITLARMFFLAFGLNYDGSTTYYQVTPECPKMTFKRKSLSIDLNKNAKPNQTWQLIRCINLWSKFWPDWKKIYSKFQVLTVSDIENLSQNPGSDCFRYCKSEPLFNIFIFQKWDRFGQKKIQLGQNFTTNPEVLSGFKFGLAFLLKSIKGDFLPKWKSLRFCQSHF